MRGRQPERNTESSADDSASPSPNAQASHASSAHAASGRAGARKSPSGGGDGDAQLMSSIQRLLLAAQTRNEKGNQDWVQHAPDAPLPASQHAPASGSSQGGATRFARPLLKTTRAKSVGAAAPAGLPGAMSGAGRGRGRGGESEGEDEGVASAAEVEELKAQIRRIQDLHEVEMREAHQMVVQAHAAASTQQGTQQATVQAPSGGNRTPSSGSCSQKFSIE